VIPAGLAGVEQQLWLWLIAMIRPGAALLAAPLFGAASVPVQLRLVLALAIGIPAAAASGMALPVDGITSIAGVLMVMSEVVTGLALGFAIQIGFAAALLGGEVISNTMGLGFASMTNPLGGQSSPAVGQLLSMLATFLFLASGGHLALAAIIIDSFITLPPGANWLSAQAVDQLLRFGGLVFAAGLAVALPVGFAMVLVQLVMGMITRSAPALNLFAVGMPATLMAGIVLLALATPAMADSIEAALSDALAQAKSLASV
jgi:flagellar biosynthetic protein FliR